MRSFTVLWRRELGAYFLSPIAYVTMMFFLVVMGFSFWFLARVLADGAAGVSIMKILFGESIFFWISLLVVVPLITMRLFAEEKRSGTIETLMTAPVTDTAVVLAKYFGALSFFIVMWLPTAAYAFVLRNFSPLLPIDLGPMMTGYLGAFLVGAFYLAIGLLTSFLTRNQIVAAIACFAAICVAFFSGFIPFFAHSDAVRDIGIYFSSVEHMREFSRGAIDSRPVLLYVTATALLIFATIQVVESRKWK